MHKWLYKYIAIVTLIEPAKPFSTGIKMKSRDQHINLIKEYFNKPAHRRAR